MRKLEELFSADRVSVLPGESCYPVVTCIVMKMYETPASM